MGETLLWVSTGLRLALRLKSFHSAEKGRSSTLFLFQITNVTGFSFELSSFHETAYKTAGTSKALLINRKFRLSDFPLSRVDCTSTGMAAPPESYVPCPDVLPRTSESFAFPKMRPAGHFLAHCAWKPLWWPQQKHAFAQAHEMCSSRRQHNPTYCERFVGMSTSPTAGRLMEAQIQHLFAVAEVGDLFLGRGAPSLEQLRKVVFVVTVLLKDVLVTNHRPLVTHKAAWQY